MTLDKTFCQTQGSAMKRCSYCGMEYPDNVEVCSIDANSLVTDVEQSPVPSKISGQLGNIITIPIKIYNLLWAAVVLLTLVSWVLSFNHPDWIIIISAVSAICWLAGAEGLLLGSRLAWSGSLLGVGAVFCFFLTQLVVGATHVWIARNEDKGDHQLIVLGLFGVVLLIPLIAGLLFLHKYLLGGCRKLSH
jgi:hypothetical protein